MNAVPERCLLCRRRPPVAGGDLIVCHPCLWAAADLNRVHGLAIIPVSLDAGISQSTTDRFRPTFVDGGDAARRVAHARRVSALREWAALVDAEPGAMGAGCGIDLQLGHWQAAGGGIPSAQLVRSLMMWWTAMSASVGAPCTPFQASIGATSQAHAGWHQAAPWLWWGGARWEPDERFALVVTVAPGIDQTNPTSAVERCFPMDDSWRDPIDVEVVAAAVATVVASVREHRRVLVRCAAGLNRSGLVVGEALAALGMPRGPIVEHLRSRRRHLVLSNPRFAHHVTTGRDDWTHDPREERR